MKTTCFVMLTIAPLLMTHHARADLLSYEGFDYEPGSVVGQNGGFGFSQPWQLNNSQGVFTVETASLTYTDAQGHSLLTRGGSLLVQGSQTADAASQPNRLLSYSRGDGGTTWVSFLAVRQGPTTNHSTFPDNPYPRSANLSLYNSVPTNQEKLAMGNTSLTVSNVVSLLPMGGNARPSSVSYSQTNFIVVRIEHSPDAFDAAYLFVNPLLSAEPDINDADASSIGQFDFTFNRIRPFAGGNRPAAQSPYAELVLDEIRIGETYNDVAPIVPKLSITRNGNTITLSWSDPSHYLQVADEVTGLYSILFDASSPHEVEISGTQQFFRLIY